MPASLGNVIGGAILVALLFWCTYGHSAEKRRAPARASGLVRHKLEREETG